MTILPQTTPAPKPIAIFMPTSRADGASEPGPSQPTPTPLPPPDDSTSNAGETAGRDSHSADDQPKTEAVDPFPQPKLRLEVRDLSHPGAERFLSAVSASSVMTAALGNVLRLLYGSPSSPTAHAPPTRSVTVIVRDMGGVAYTTGSELDNDHKEIHFSLSYIAHIAPEARVAAEVTGVLTHELVHCLQWNGAGTCPGGLIEGVADWVRLRCGLSPPHWRRETGGAWDRGYQHTAYFLDYLEGRFGDGTVRRLNEKLRNRPYEEKPFWTELVGRPVEQLWGDYVKETDNGGAAANGPGSQATSTVDEGTQTYPLA